MAINRRLRQPASTSGFLAWPEASSLVFLVSAASLLGGVWGLLAPGIDDAARLGERFAAVGILHLYQLALLGVGGLLCRWRGGNPDAIGIALLVACFAIGTSAGLDTLASDRPWTTLALGLASLPLLGVGGWWLGRRVLGRIEPHLGLAAGVLVLWHALAPGWLGWSFTAHLDDVVHRDPQGAWLSGVWLAVAVALALLPAAVRFTPDIARDVPFLRRAGMRWLLVLVLLVAGVLHLLLLDHAFTLERGLGAGLVPLALVLLLGNELRQRTWGDGPGWDVAAVGVPGLAALMAALDGGGGHGSWADAITTPAAVAVVVGLTACALGRIRGRMIELGLASLLLAVLVTGASGGWLGLDWSAFLLACPLFLIALGLRRRRQEFAYLALIVGGYALVMLPSMCLRLIGWNLAPAAVLMLACGAGALALTFILRRTPRGILHAAAWSFALGGYHCCLRSESLLPAPLLGVGAIALVLGAIAWRRRDPVLVAPLALPLIPALLLVRAAWVGIGGAFALLAAGAWLSWRRIRRPGPEPAAVTAGVVEPAVP